MKILVTGGTGFTGHNLSKRLLQDRHQVRLLVRSRARVALDPHPALEILDGDIRDREAVDKAVAGTAKIFNIASYSSVHLREGNVDRMKHIAMSTGFIFSPVFSLVRYKYV